MSSIQKSTKSPRTIWFESRKYPYFQSTGFAAQFAIPYATQVCKGIGVDVGCNRSEWAFPGAIQVDPTIDNRYHARQLPEDILQFDYVFSSHCLEHLDRWVEVLDYWRGRLKDGGVLFLYLPDFSQHYWRPWHNRKHINVFTPEIMKAYFEDHMHDVFCSGIDLNNAFMIYGYNGADNRGNEEI